MSEFKVKPTQKKPPQHQVRFWCDEALYRKFQLKCDNNEVNYSHALQQLMEYFLRSRKP